MIKVDQNVQFNDVKLSKRAVLDLREIADAAAQSCFIKKDLAEGSFLYAQLEGGA